MILQHPAQDHRAGGPGQRQRAARPNDRPARATHRPTRPGRRARRREIPTTAQHTVGQREIIHLAVHIQIRSATIDNEGARRKCPAECGCSAGELDRASKSRTCPRHIAGAAEAVRAIQIQDGIGTEREVPAVSST